MMADAEDHAELNRLVSGELADAESLELMKRMLRDEALRRQYDRLVAVDELVREAYLADSAGAGGEAADASDAVEADGLAPERRRAQVEAILGRIQGGKRVRRRRPGRRAIGWIRRQSILPWVIAASVALASGLVLRMGWSGQKAAMDQVRRMDPKQAAHYADVRAQLGEASMAVIWTNDGVSEVGNLGAVGGPRRCEVFVRVTIVRTRGDEAERWSVDALMRRDQVIELATQTQRSWPASVKVSAKPGKDSHIPVSIEARLTEDPPVAISNERLVLTPSEPTSVGSVTSEGCRYELFIEAIGMEGTGSAI